MIRRHIPARFFLAMLDLEQVTDVRILDFFQLHKGVTESYLTCFLPRINDIDHIKYSVQISFDRNVRDVCSLSDCSDFCSLLQTAEIQFKPTKNKSKFIDSCN